MQRMRTQGHSFGRSLVRFTLGSLTYKTVESTQLIQCVYQEDTRKKANYRPVVFTLFQSVMKLQRETCFILKSIEGQLTGFIPRLNICILTFTQVCPTYAPHWKFCFHLLLSKLPPITLLSSYCLHSRKYCDE